MAELAVWVNGYRAGFWRTTPQGDEFQYDEAWLSEDNPLRRPLSLSLGFLPGNAPYKGARVRNFFDNLLPDSDRIRRRLASQHRLDSVDAFDLLRAIGRDCVGAIQLLPVDEIPADLRSIRGQPLTEAGVATVLRHALSAAPAALQDGAQELRISIAGAQEKTALLYHDGQWMLPQGSTPSTHILKLPMGELIVSDGTLDMRHSVENEWLCGQIMQAWGVPTATSEILHFEDRKVLSVARFDRRLARDGQWILRLPQEDFCQALGVNSLNKYTGQGGPDAEQINAVLSRPAADAADRVIFFQTLVIFWMLAAIDGHAKNFSLFLLAGSRYRLTPLYDVLSAHPVMGSGRGKYHESKVKLAMPVRGESGPHYLVSKIQARQWVHFGAHVLGLGTPRAMADMLATLAGQAGPVIAAVEGKLPADFPPQVASSIFKGLRKYADKLMLGLDVLAAS
ncbi:type II toxin-antitoxin system HipA family toxin [Silvimonas iriomotensis]|uniref:Transcriptional regulator n=1 Tax=Silvimonas iriomotensis TaxID=449662 RepID=A0ABQ2P5X4_9NEIS|nr:type II toxin-antitoxin system HipA family toxin [Silvimonas iriomotensis]GGP18835.1 transcriptional regulator [Silvimonas iriomotensis]